MELILNFSSGWWAQMILVYGTLLVTIFLRKSYKNKQEIKKMFIMGVVAVLFAFIAEFLGISLNLWTYFPGNWPLPVWLGYFGVGLLGYQFARLLDRK